MSGQSFKSLVHVWKISFKAQIISGPSSQSPVPVWPIVSILSEVFNYSKAHVSPGKPSLKSFTNLLQVFSTFVVENLVANYQCLLKLVSGRKKNQACTAYVVYPIHHTCLSSHLHSCLSPFPHRYFS